MKDLILIIVTLSTSGPLVLRYDNLYKTRFELFYERSICNGFGQFIHIHLQNIKYGSKYNVERA